MARLTTPEDSALSAHGREVRDRIIESRGEIGGPFTVLLHSPDLARDVAEVGAYVRFHSPLPADLRCLATLLVARAFDCEFEWAGWVPQALDAGLAPDVVEAVQRRRTPPGLTPLQRLVHDFCRQLLERRRVARDLYDDVLARLGTATTVDLAGTVGYFAMLACVMNAFEVDAPDGAPRLIDLHRDERD